MLVLSRRIGEKIIIGDYEVEMIVLAYEKGQVKLGFEADKKIKINREEVFIKIKNEQQQAKLQPELDYATTANDADVTNEEEDK